MKSSITSDWRPLLRALHPFIIAIAVLWATPRNAQAFITDKDELLISNRPENGLARVSKYDATTGEVIDANFITTYSPGPLAIYDVGMHDDALWVGDAIDGGVGEYHAGDGEPIKRDFITGVFSPYGLAVYPSQAALFVADTSGAKVGKYSAADGEPIKRDFITGLFFPYGLAVWQDRLYVGNGLKETVEAYNAIAGDLINPNFITGLKNPFGLAVSGNNLFVATYSKEGRVGKYIAYDGAAINANLVTGLEYPIGVALSGNTLFVAYFGLDPGGKGTIGKYDATTGAAINANFITGLSRLFGIAVLRAKRPH